jgi:hypothetical protein
VESCPESTLLSLAESPGKPPSGTRPAEITRLSARQAPSQTQTRKTHQHGPSDSLRSYSSITRYQARHSLRLHPCRRCMKVCGPSRNETPAPFPCMLIIAFICMEWTLDGGFALSFCLNPALSQPLRALEYEVRAVAHGYDGTTEAKTNRLVELIYQYHITVRESMPMTTGSGQKDDRRIRASKFEQNTPVELRLRKLHSQA